MLSRVLSNSFTTRSIHLIRALSSQKLNINSEVIQKYGRDVPVEVPRLTEAIQFPITPFHYDYENVWRRLIAWASDYLEEQDDLIVLARWNPAYGLGWPFAHLTSEAYLAICKIFVSTIYCDWVYDTRLTKKQKKRGGQEFMTRLLEKKYPKDAQFTRHIDMVIDSYRSLKPWINEKQDKELKLLAGKFLTAELLTPNKVDHQVDLNKYIKHRADTYANDAQLKLHESAYGFVIDDQLSQHPDIRMINDASGQLKWLPNDLLSFKYEQANDDHWNNFITVYARQNDVSLQEGVEKIIDYINDKIVEFQTLMWKIVNSDLAVKHPGLKDFLEIGLANTTYGNFQTYAVTGKYTGKMVYVKDPKRNDRIDPKELYLRIKTP